MVTKEERGREGCSVWDQQIRTNTYKHQGPII